MKHIMDACLWRKLQLVRNITNAIEHHIGSKILSA
jgi:hypothetical protein